MAHHWIGTSGWSYDGWAGLVYPPGLKRTDWLGHYAGLLPSVEINATFYHLPRDPVIAGWAAHTPAGFLFAVKAWRAITHYRRLADCAEPLDVFLGRIAGLGDKLGPVLFQLPPRFHADPDRLEAFLALLPRERRFAFEFRDPDWHREEVYGLLTEHNAAFCAFEFAGSVSPREATANFIYVRLHGRAGRYRGNYSDEELAEWASWLAEGKANGRDVYVYFDNTDEADYAVRNAQRLNEILGAA